MASDPEHAPTLLVLACIALEEGSAREASSVISRLKAATPLRKEPLLLERLLAYRQQEPGGSWIQAFTSAWMEAGRPDFEAHHLLAEVELESRDMEALRELWRGTSDSNARLMLALAARPMTSEQSDWLLQQIPVLNDVALYLAAFNALSHEALPEPVLVQSVPVLHRRLSQLADAHPGSLQLRLLAQLAGTHEEAPFDTHDLTVLRTLSALPAWREHCLADTFLSARQVFRDAGLSNAGSWASSVAALATADRGSLLLRKRAKATRRGLAPSARHSLGQILSQVGARMAEESTLLERTLGLLMMQQGAEDQQDPMTIAKADALLEDVSAAQRAWRKAALDRWPLHSLLEDGREASARDELAFLYGFIAPLRSP